MTPAPPVVPLFQDIRALLGTFPSPAGPDVGKSEAMHGQAALPVLPERMVAELGKETNHLTKPYRSI